MRFFLLFFCSITFGQSFDIGTPIDNCTGSIWNSASPGFVAMGEAPWDTLRFAPAFSCSYPFANGIYTVDLGLMEPNKTGPGQRVFTVAANGSSSAPLDLFGLAGTRKPYTLRMVAVVNNGVLRLDFKAIGTGNAVASGVTIHPLGWVDRMGYTGPMVQIVTEANEFKPARFLNGTIAIDVDNGPAYIAFGYPNLLFSVPLVRHDDVWEFPEYLPNPSWSVGVYLNGLRVRAELRWSDQNTLPAGVFIAGSKDGDEVLADYVVEGLIKR